MQDKVFYSICFGFIFGVFLRSFLFIDFYLVILLGFISFALFLFFSLISKNKWGIIASVFILAFCFGIFRFHMVDVSPPSTFESEVGQKFSFVGEIIDEPDVRENNQKLIIEVSAPQGLALDSLKARPFPAKTKILVTVNFGEDFKYGDEVKLSGKLEKPENFVTDQGKNFDYINYLRKDGILYVMNYADAEIISHGHGNKIKSFLFSIKEKFVEKINLAIQSPESLLMGGLILGEKSAFDQSLRQSFVNTGTIHIVALSGYNVTIVAEWFMKLFKFLPQQLGIGMGILAILLFVLMTGGSSTAIRAGIMATLALVARATGRNYDVARGLILAGVFMIILNPFVLVYDVSFQLSFIATIAVIFFAPRIEKYFMWVTERFQLRDIVSVTCAAYIFVLPFILYKMGNLSIVALPANILILPFIPFTMFLGCLTGFVGLIFYVFAVPIGYISYLFLHYELWIVGFFSNLPFASFSFPNFPLVLTIIIYAYFIYRLFGRSIKSFFIN
ncbi:MAG: ComEC/Rec2 family competence protein [bacterium]